MSTPTTRPAHALVIFDCDGVLVDSERIAFETLCTSLAGLGIVLDAEGSLQRYLGRRDEDIYRSIAEESGRTLPPDFIARRDALLHEVLRRELRAISGVREVLEASALRRCVASSSDPRRIRISLEAAGLAALFDADAVFSGSQVAHGKPAPDLFLLAAERMGCAPSRCLVIEDSPAGVQAGRAAGMAVLGFAGGGHVNGGTHGALLAQAGAGHVFHDMAELPRLIAAWEAGL